MDEDLDSDNSMEMANMQCTGENIAIDSMQTYQNQHPLE